VADEDLQPLRVALGEDASEHAWEVGRALSTDEALALELRVLES
jgi:hypothetical protein